MRRFYFTMMMLSLAVIAFAQEFAITGRVVDAEDNEGLPLAQVSLLTKDSVKVTNEISDNEGYFKLKPKSPGEYLLSVTFIGYEPLWKKVRVSEKNPHKKMGQLKMAVDRKLLSELKVTGLAQELTIKADTFIYHSNAFRVPEGASLAALVKQLPGLQMDEEGNLTFQGKAVGTILINGKPFFGDANTAMSNMTSDAVEDLKVYEKTDEEKEFAGLHDTNKQTVIDLKIKKEYMSSWNVNASAAGGTNERFLGKVFASNFNDKYRAAVYAQVNNLSQWQRVDENGNWSHWSLPGALRTFRTVGTILSWSNGKKNTDKGYLDANAEFSYNHDNSTSLSTSNSVYLISDNIKHYEYSRHNSRNSSKSPRMDVNITWNIDTLNRIELDAHYSNYSSKYRGSSQAARYNKEAWWSDAHKHLLGDNIENDAQAAAISTNESNGRSNYYSNNLGITTNYTRRLVALKGALTVTGRVYGGSNNDAHHSKSRYLYFNTQEPQVKRGDYNYSSEYNYRYILNTEYQASLGKHLNYSFSYNYEHNEEKEGLSLYRFDRYSTLDYPLGWKPSTADSLFAVKDLDNSRNSINYKNVHTVSGVVSGVWNKFEFYTALNTDIVNEKIFFTRDEEQYSPQRKVVNWSPMAHMKFKPTEGAELTLDYSGSIDHPELNEKIPFTDTSSESTTIIRNGNLSSRWSNNFSLRGKYFGSKRGDTYNMYSNVTLYNNDRTNTMLIDPVTGKATFSTVNVSGNYNYFISLNTQQPLDSARHWTLTAQTSLRASRNKSYTGSTNDGMGLSVMHSYSPSAGMTLKWRKDIWSIVLSGSYNGDILRYDAQGYNQTGATFEWNIQPMVELPFGMKINSSFGLYGRRGYSDDIMNHDQWLWNLSVSQSLLKNKALTLQLDAVDILGQRTSEFFFSDNTQRTYNSTKSYLSYVMLSAVYRFNIGGK